MSLLRKLGHTSLVIAIPIVIALLATRLVMTPLFLNIEYTRAGFPADTYGFSTEDRLEYGVYGVEYILNGEDIDFLGDLTLPIDLCWNPIDPNAETCPMYNSRELKHMVDVKNVATMLFAIAWVLTPICTISLIWLWRSHRNRFIQIMRHSSMTTLSTITTLAVIAVVAWDFFFTNFHRLFFEAGTWQFYFSDTLIRLYPQQFWFDASLTVGAIVILSSLFMLWWSFRQPLITSETNS